MKFNYINKTTVLTLFFLAFQAQVLIAEKTISSTFGRSSSKTMVPATDQFDGNRVRNDLENNGMIVSHRITGHSGMEWPKENNTYSIYASGIWYAGKVGDDLRCATAEYGPEMVSGPFGENS